MDYNNFNHYAKEHMTSLRSQSRTVEPWYSLGANVTPLARLRAFFKALTTQPRPVRQRQS
jgi:hypothetical protein